MAARRKSTKDVNAAGCECVYYGDEPSPKGLGFCGHCVKPNTVKKGRDGNMWKATLDSADRNIWRKVPAAAGRKQSAGNVAAGRKQSAGSAAAASRKQSTGRKQSAGAAAAPRKTSVGASRASARKTDAPQRLTYGVPQSAAPRRKSSGRVDFASRPDVFEFDFEEAIAAPPKKRAASGKKAAAAGKKRAASGKKAAAAGGARKKQATGAAASGKPKKPMGAFLLFSADNRDAVRATFREEKVPASEVSKVLGAMWRGMSDSQKQEYTNEANAAMEDYHAAGY